MKGLLYQLKNVWRDKFCIRNPLEPDQPVYWPDFGRADGRYRLHQNCDDRVYGSSDLVLLSGD